MLQISDTPIPVSDIIHYAYFDDAFRLIYGTFKSTVALNLADRSSVSTGWLDRINRYSADSCIGFRDGGVCRWNYLANESSVFDIAHIGSLSNLYYDHNQGIGVLRCRGSDDRAQFLLLDSNGKPTELLQNDDNEFLLGLETTDRGMLACMGVENEFDTTQIRYLDRFNEPIAFKYRTIIFPKYLFRYELRPSKKTHGQSVNTILTNKGEIVFELERREGDLFFVYMCLHDGVRFVAYYDNNLLLFSAAQGEILAKLPKRSSPLLHSEAGGYILGEACADDEEPDSSVKDYWLFDLKANQVSDTIRLPDSYDRAVCNNDGSKILLYKSTAHSRDNRPHAVLLDRL